jgi:transforming growth factor-beta-induced protein
MRFSQVIALSVLACSQVFIIAAGFLDHLNETSRENFTLGETSFLPINTTRNLATQPITSVVAGQSDLSTFSTYIVTSNLQYALSQPGTFTVFAPTNGAFASLSQAYLKKLQTSPWILHLQELVIMHVTLARVLYKNSFSNGMIITTLGMENATVTVTKNPYNVRFTNQYTKKSDIISYDYGATNGVVQKVNRVLIPSFYRTNMMQLLKQYNDFSILVSLIQSVPGLGKTLKESDVTLFAPTNQAWQALGQNKLNSLKTNVKELKKLLQYHMLPNVVPTLQFKNNAKYTTIQGSKATLTVQNSVVYFNDAKIVTGNALARNGIGHALNKVLTLP